MGLRTESVLIELDVGSQQLQWEEESGVTFSNFLLFQLARERICKSKY